MPTKQEIKDARKKVGNIYGTNLANKASDEFCLTMGLVHGAFGNTAFTESLSTVQPRATVIEFSSTKKKAKKLQSELKEVFANKDWAALQKSFNEISGDTEYLTSVKEAVRQSRLKSVRDEFYKTCGAIGNEIERGARGFQPGLEATASPLTPSSVTEVCWLNETMRTWVDPRLLAEVAADNKIEKIDLPRRIEKEIKTSLKTIRSPEYRTKFGGSGKGIIVAVIDSEVALQHPALRNRVVQKQNYCKELWGNPDSHGTTVAGIIASNDADFTGIAPEATIYNYKIIATLPHLNADDFGGALAIQQALEDGAHIANCSWGAGLAGKEKSREAKACDTAWALGLTIVKSAGNRGPGSQTITTPADADGVIVVGATDKEGLEVQNYSSRGSTADGRTRPHLVAPGGIHNGVGIFSCLTGGGFDDCGAGTSFAAPHVSGMLALLLEQQSELSPDELREMLLDCCAAFNPNDDNIHGKGFVSFANLL